MGIPYTLLFFDCCPCFFVSPMDEGDGLLTALCTHHRSAWQCATGLPPGYWLQCNQTSHNTPTRHWAVVAQCDPGAPPSVATKSSANKSRVGRRGTGSHRGRGCRAPPFFRRRSNGLREGFSPVTSSSGLREGFSSVSCAAGESALWVAITLSGTLSNIFNTVHDRF